MTQVTKRVQSLSQTVQEVEEDICWLQRHTVNGVVPQKIQKELQELLQVLPGAVVHRSLEDLARRRAAAHVALIFDALLGAALYEFSRIEFDRILI